MRKASERDAQPLKFSNILAHEIKNPLGTIDGLLSYSLSNINSENIKEYLSKSQAELKRINKLVNDFLYYGREININKSNINVLSLIDKTISLLSYQVKLLRVLQDKTIEKIGSIKKIRIDVRIIAATNKDLKTLVEEGKFREDLFYRINVFSINIPPLRERKMDIPLLVEFFIKKYAKKYEKIILNTTNDFMDRLYKYNFLGNVRELENLIERAVIIARSEKLDTNLLSELTNSEDVAIDNLNISNKEIELIKCALRQAKGNKSKAANILGISRKSLYNKINEYNISI